MTWFKDGEPLKARKDGRISMEVDGEECLFTLEITDTKVRVVDKLEFMELLMTVTLFDLKSNSHENKVLKLNCKDKILVMKQIHVLKWVSALVCPGVVGC